MALIDARSGRLAASNRAVLPATAQKFAFWLPRLHAVRPHANGTTAQFQVSKQICKHRRRSVHANSVAAITDYDPDDYEYSEEELYQQQHMLSHSNHDTHSSSYSPAKPAVFASNDDSSEANSQQTHNQGSSVDLDDGLSKQQDDNALDAFISATVSAWMAVLALLVQSAVWTLGTARTAAIIAGWHAVRLVPHNTRRYLTTMVSGNSLSCGSTLPLGGCCSSQGPHKGRHECSALYSCTYMSSRMHDMHVVNACCHGVPLCLVAGI